MVHTMGFIERRRFQEHHKKTVYQKERTRQLWSRQGVWDACRIAHTILGRCYGYCFLLNKQWPSRSSNGGIPEEALIGKKVNYSFLRTLDCAVFVHIDKENKTNLEGKSKKCTFIGYGVNHFGYHLYDYENHKIIRIRYVIFNEKVMYKDQLQRKKREQENT